MTFAVSVIAGATAIVALSLATVVVLRRESAALRHWLLASALCCAAALPAVKLIAPEWNVPIDVAPQVLSEIGERETSAPMGDISLSIAAPELSPGRFTLLDGLLLVWAAGSLVAFCVLIAALLRLRHIARHAVHVDDHRVQLMAQESAAAQGLRCPVRLLFGASSSHVVTWGLRRPTILLPMTALDWTDDRLRIVLFHEFAHVHRADWLVQIVAVGICCVHWFNPLFWMAQRRLRHESERACDDAVLSAGVDATDYAHHLVAVAQEAGRSRSLWSPATAIAHSSTLEERIHAMLNARLKRTPITGRKRSLTALAVMLLTLLAAGVGSSPTAMIAASGQSSGGIITGTFYDQHSGVLPGVDVTLTNESTNAALAAVTDSNGSVVFRALAPGTYVMVSRLAGFAPVTNTIRVAAGAEVQRNIMLPIGTVQETVTMTADGSPGRATGSIVTRTTRTIPQPTIASPCVANRIGGCLKPPTKAVDVKPIYPESLAASRIEGVVLLQARIGLDGYVNDLRVAPDGDPATHPEFVAAAMEAVQQWEFNPTILNGVPVETNITITVRFTASVK